MTATTQTTWALDPAHSEVQFKIRHLVISTVTGNFKSFNASVVTSGEGFENALVEFDAEINSIDTGVEQRDAHLKSADFFNADEFPRLTFKSTSLKPAGDGRYELTGELTLRGVTKEISLNVEFGGTMVDPYGNTKAGFEVEGKINRKEFGLTWNGVTEAGGVVVSDEVKILCNIQLNRQG